MIKTIRVAEFPSAVLQSSEAAWMTFESVDFDGGLEEIEISENNVNLEGKEVYVAQYIYRNLKGSDGEGEVAFILYR